MSFITHHCFSPPVLRTVLGRVFDLSSFRPPDQYPFLCISCYHSLMNTASQPAGLTLSQILSSAEGSAAEEQPGSNQPGVPSNPSEPSAANRTCPHTPFWSQTPRSRLSTFDSRLFSNREPKSSQKMLSASQSATCNFLIGKKFNISRSPSPAAAPIPLPPSKLLDFSLTSPKSITSKFLIDNFGACLTRRPPWPRTVAAEGSHSAPLSFASFAPFASSTSCISNRPSPRLEMVVSYRKQEMALISNRPQFVLSNFALRAPAAPKHAAAKAGPWPLSSLIANETHSREESSACKQSIYQILIANEFHRCGSSLPAVEGHGISQDRRREGEF